MPASIGGNIAHSSEQSGEVFWIIQDTRSPRAFMTIVDPWTVRCVATPNPKRFVSKALAIGFAESRCSFYSEEYCIPRLCVNAGDFLLVKQEHETLFPRGRFMTADDVARFCE